MSKTTPKIVLSSARDIPFNKLILSQSNVCKVKTGVSIEELAEDIARRTLLQSLSVRAVLDEDGAETGMYEVPAGGRRFRALELLVKQKRMAKTQPVPCVVREGGIAEEDSLAENAHREALHPLDQFRAFVVLREKGLSDDDIAARFFVTPAIVRQRLKLAAVSQRLLDLYAAEEMTLEQLMAFTVTDDHARQEQAWDSLQQGWNKSANYIRRILTESAVNAADRRAQFVGLEAYVSAGGLVTRDLFEDDDGGWLQDPALLERLATEKLKAEAEKLSAEGWKWISVAIDFPYGHRHGLRRIVGEAEDMTEEETAARDALVAEYDRLQAQYEDADDLPDEVDTRLGELEKMVAAMDNRPVRYATVDIARAGVFISLDDEGTLDIERGFVRPEDEEAEEPADAAPGGGRPDGQPACPPSRIVLITVGGEPAGEDEESDDDAVRPLSDRLLAELSAHRTLALRNAVAQDPDTALTALLVRLCWQTFDRASGNGGCLQVSVTTATFAAQPVDLKSAAAAQAIEHRQRTWQSILPAEPKALWAAIAALDDGSRLQLLAHCIAPGVNALYEPIGRFGDNGSTRRLADADHLAAAVGLDMEAAGWKPTADNYLGRVSKARILEAVREAKGEASAQLIDHLKKGEMAKEAERLLDGTGWLPECLRRPVTENLAEEALPGFLAGETAMDDQTPELIAAE